MTEWNGIKVGGLYKRTGIYASQLPEPIVVMSIELTAPEDRINYCKCGKDCDGGEWVDVCIFSSLSRGCGTLQLRMTESGVEWAGRSLAQQEGSEDPTFAWPYQEMSV